MLAMNIPGGLRLKPVESWANERRFAEIRSLLGRRRRTEHSVFRPRSLSHYELLKRVGEGSRGTVYLARDRQLERFVAIKMMRGSEDPESRKRFLREARCAAAINHPNVVTIYEIGHDRQIDFIVMEYVPGKPLDQAITKHGMPLEICLTSALQMAGALAAIHGAKMIHRDLKPSNFVITTNGIVKLLDFGLAKVMTPRRARSSSKSGSERLETREGTIMGTTGYMSPEQVRGQPADRRSDVFSFGAILYEMLSGRRAFQAGSAVETMSAVLHETPRKLPARIPAPIAKTVRCALEKELGLRYPTAKELSTALALAAQRALKVRSSVPSGLTFPASGFHRRSRM
jgi:serine/threonine protein kinase